MYRRWPRGTIKAARVRVFARTVVATGGLCQPIFPSWTIVTPPFATNGRPFRPVSFGQSLPFGQATVWNCS